MNGVRADSTDTSHDDGLAGLDPRGVDRGTVSGGNPAANQRGDLEGNVRRDLDEGALAHHRIAAEGAQETHRVEIAAPGVDPECSVGPGAHQ